MPIRESTVTQYYFTVPSQYLEIALRAERSRATGLLLTPKLWDAERGAITQEVRQDDSNAFYRIYQKMQRRLLGGTPYDNNTLGTVSDFAHRVDSAQLRKFYDAWYHPNDGIFIIAGAVDPQATIARVRELFGDVPAARLPQRAAVRLEPIRPALYRDRSDQAFTAVALGYRYSGVRQPGLCGRTDSRRRPLQPAQPLRRLGIHRQSARRAVRLADVSESRRWASPSQPFR